MGRVARVAKVGRVAKGSKSDPVSRLKAGLVTRNDSSTSDTLIRCPFCDAEISATARKCRYCSEWVAGRCRQCGAGVRKKWAAQSLCANCEQVVSDLRSCTRCGVQTIHVQQEPNHVLHLLLSVFTIGIWLPVWALVGFLPERPRCAVCGRKAELFGLW